MQEYLHRSRLGEIMDTLGFHLLALALCLGWFIGLWGVRLSALTAGAALYILILLIRRKTREGRLLRREKKLRARIGGELALERLLLSPADKAHFEVAVLLSLRQPLTLLQAGEDGMLCGLRGEKLLIAFAQSPFGGGVGAERVLALQKAAALRRADRGVLCAPCKISPEAQEQARSPLPVTFLSRDQLVALFGASNPATDAQLAALGRRKRAQAPRRVLRGMLDRRRAARYAFYGGLLMILYLLTRSFYYAVPGLLCLALAAASRCVREQKEKL